MTSVILALFLPCIAQSLMNVKERGLKLALGIMGFVMVVPCAMGFILNEILTIPGVS